MLLKDRFWANVAKSDEASCWLWTASSDSSGYGTISHGGRRSKHQMGAHRLSYEMHKGPIPKGFIVMHSCDTPGCVNPAHLVAGTFSENTRDMYTKGRHPKGAQAVCIKGHPFDEANTYRPARGGRSCRACNRARKRNAT